MPVGVHLGVVDPGVGTHRRAIAIQAARGDLLVGPDNGLLMPVADALGGPIAARELTNRDLWLPVASSTFHGRDIFAPVTAHLAASHVPFDAVGDAIAIDSLVRLPAIAPRVAPGRIETEVEYVDSFGNLRLSGGLAELTGAFGVLAEGAGLHISFGTSAAEDGRFARSFGHVAAGEMVLYIDSSGDLAIAANQADLGARIGGEAGMPVTIERAG
jgi:S-adenosylmethionine hydrolase